MAIRNDTCDYCNKINRCYYTGSDIEEKKTDKKTGKEIKKDPFMYWKKICKNCLNKFCCTKQNCPLCNKNKNIKVNDTLKESYLRICIECAQKIIANDEILEKTCEYPMKKCECIFCSNLKT
jgi:hypothetical protein